MSEAVCTTEEIVPLLPQVGVTVPGPGAEVLTAFQWFPDMPMPFADCTAIGIDTETEPIVNGAEIIPVSMQIAGDRSSEVVFVHPAHFRDALDCLETTCPGLRWVFFNAPFDCRVLGWPDCPAWGVLHEGRLIDMEIRSILHYLQEGTYTGFMNLEELARRALHWELDKDKVLRTSFRRNTELSVRQAAYAAQDAIATVRAMSVIPDALPTEDLNVKGYFALSAASWTGMRVDMDELRRLSAKMLDEQRRLHGMLQVFGVAPANPDDAEDGSPSGINARKQELLHSMEDLYRKSGLEKFRLPRTKTGTIATEKKSLDMALITSGVPLPIWLNLSRAYDHARKIRSTYLNPELVGLDGRVHPRFSPLMKTGRTSASKPNTQNLTRKGGIRGIYIPSDGFLYLATDFNQLELCSLAQSCWTRFGTSKMRELINEGQDLHYWFGDILAQQVGVVFTPEEAESDRRKEFRSRAKAANFGYPGGLGAATFVAYARGYGVDISLKESEEIRDLWLHHFPEMRLHLAPVVDEYWTTRNIQVYLSSHNLRPAFAIRTMQELTEYLMEQGKTPDEAFKATSGLAAYECRLVSGRLKRNCTFCAAANMQFQGLAADGAKIGLWEGYMQGWRVVNFIHDEIIQEVPVAWTPEQHTLYIEHVEKTLCDCMRQVLPDVAVRAESALMPRWYKEASLLKDKDGLVMVWTPEEAARRKAAKEAARLAA